MTTGSRGSRAVWLMRIILFKSWRKSPLRWSNWGIYVPHRKRCGLYLSRVWPSGTKGTDDIVFTWFRYMTKSIFLTDTVNFLSILWNLFLCSYIIYMSLDLRWGRSFFSSCPSFLMISNSMPECTNIGWLSWHKPSEYSSMLWCVSQRLVYIRCM